MQLWTDPSADLLRPASFLLVFSLLPPLGCQGVAPTDPGSADTAGALAVEAAAPPALVRCGTTISAAAITRVEDIHRAGGVFGGTFGPITVPVYVHVITDAAGDGAVRSAQIADQIAVLNAGFAGSGLSFTLMTVDVTANATWFTACQQGATWGAMGTQLREGGMEALNLYTCDPAGGLLGVAQYPWAGTSLAAGDGVILAYQTLPGGSLAPYSLGDTGTHEVGHWLALYHTFQGGCTGQGERVSDTPAEASPSYSCSLTRDTCPGGGTDPVSNFMDYTDDSFMTAFTSRQKTRARAVCLLPPVAARSTAVARCRRLPRAAASSPRPGEGGRRRSPWTRGSGGGW